MIVLQLIRLNLEMFPGLREPRGGFDTFLFLCRRRSLGCDRLLAFVTTSQSGGLVCTLGQRFPKSLVHGTLSALVILSRPPEPKRNTPISVDEFQRPHTAYECLTDFGLFVSEIKTFSFLFF